MKKKIFFIFFGFVFLIAPVQGKINSYFSFEYLKGQVHSDFSRGSFENAQIGLIFSGEITPRVGFISEVRFRGENNVEIEQALLRLNLSRSFSLQLGLYLVPFGKYNSSSRPHQTSLIQHPLHVEKMYPLSWRDLGVLIEGDFSGLFYSAYIGNGLHESVNLTRGQQFKDNNSDKARGGKLGLALSREVEIGYSYYKGKYDEGNKRDLNLQGWYFAWEAQSFHILSEYSKAKLENPENFEKGKAEGYFVQLSFDIDGLMPVVSYQRVKYEDPFHGQGFVNLDYPGVGISTEKSRWALGLVYLVAQNVFIKVEYDFNREKDVELQDNVFTAQVALSF
jgi:hypothetical protein